MEQSLIEAIVRRDFSRVELLLKDKKQKKSLQLRDTDGNSALHVAVLNRTDPQILAILLKHTDPSLRNENAQLAEELAVGLPQESAYLEVFRAHVAQLVRDSKEDILERWVRRGWIPPDEKIENEAVFQELANVSAVFSRLRNISKNITTSHQQLLSGQIGLSGNLNAVEKQDILSLDYTGFSAVHKAVILELVGVLQRLIQNDGSTFLAALDHMDRSALHYAAVLESTEIINLLSEVCDSQLLAARDLKELTPLQYKSKKDVINVRALRSLLIDSEGTSTSDGGWKTSNLFKMPVRTKERAPEFQTRDAFYMYHSIGDALVMALAEVVQRQPPDPIEYLALWLRRHHADIQQAMLADEERRQMEDARRAFYEEERLKVQLKRELEKQRAIEEERQKAEAEMKRAKINAEIFNLERVFERDRDGRTELHRVVSQADKIGQFKILDLIIEGHNFALRDAGGKNCRQLAEEAKNKFAMEEFDTIVMQLLENGDLAALECLSAWGYVGSMPDVREIYGPDAFGLPDSAVFLVDEFPKYLAQLSMVWAGSREGPIGILEQLVDQKSLLLARDPQGRSALHMAVQNKNEEAIRYICSTCPQAIHLCDNLNRRPIHYAYTAGGQFVDILLEYGADVEVRDALGRQPSQYLDRGGELPDLPPLTPEQLKALKEEQEVEGDKDLSDAEETDTPKEGNEEPKLHSIQEEPEPILEAEEEEEEEED